MQPRKAVLLQASNVRYGVMLLVRTVRGKLAHRRRAGNVHAGIPVRLDAANRCALLNFEAGQSRFRFGTQDSPRWGRRP